MIEVGKNFMNGWNYFDEPPAESGNYQVRTTCGITTLAYYNTAFKKWQFGVPYSRVDAEYWRTVARC